jgi:hypothetical protein
MTRPPNLSLNELLSVQLAQQALDAAGVPSAERQSLLLVPPTLFCRDIHALDQAAVVFLFELSTPTSEADLLQAGAFVYGDYGSNWWANKVRTAPATSRQQMQDSASNICIIAHKDALCMLTRYVC